MEQRRIILTVLEDKQANSVVFAESNLCIGYAGEHLATILGFNLPENWLNQSEKYQICFRTSDGKCYSTDLLDIAELALPSGIMIAGALYVQVIATDSDGTVIKKTEVCKCTVGKSIADGEIIAKYDGVKLASQLTEELQAAIGAAKEAQDNLMSSVATASGIKTSLGSATKSANTAITNLQSTTSVANTVKTSLETATENANAAKTNLETAITNAATATTSANNAAASANSASTAATNAASAANTAAENLQADISDANGKLSAINEAISGLQAYVGYTNDDIIGLQVDYANKKFTRLAGAVGKEAGEDFDSFAMYGGRRRCNVLDDGTITAYYDDEGYTDDGSNGQVMVYQPAFYYKVVPLKLDKNTDSGIGYHIRKANYYVSATPHTGFKLHPAFYDENGNAVDYILYSAYEGSMYDTSVAAYVNDDTDTGTDIDLTADLLCSVGKGKKPISGLYKQLTRVNAETLAKNRGAGWHIDTIKSISANQLLMMIELGTMNTQSAVGLGVVSITDNSAYNCSSFTGSTATLGNSTGMAESTVNRQGSVTANYTENGKVSVSYRGIENPWGNIWKFVNGINIWGDGTMCGGQAYIADDFNFMESKQDSNYSPVGFTLPNANGFVGAMGYGGEKYDWLFLPSEVGGTSASPVGDFCYIVSNLTEYKICQLGGNWVSSVNAGGFCYRTNSSAATRYVNFGARLLYVPAARI